MIVRIAQNEEVAAVINLYRGYDRPPAADMEASEMSARFAELNRSGYVAVAVKDEAIVGSYSMYFCASLAHAGRPFAVIENVIVAPHMRRHGIGRLLMAHAQESARAKDCYKVMLSTGVSRPQNRRFYEACGFVGDKVGFQVRYGA